MAAILLAGRFAVDVERIRPLFLSISADGVVVVVVEIRFFLRQSFPVEMKRTTQWLNKQTNQTKPNIFLGSFLGKKNKTKTNQRNERERERERERLRECVDGER